MYQYRERKRVVFFGFEWNAGLNDLLLIDWRCFDFRGLGSVLFIGPETFFCERSVIQTSHWEPLPKTWKSEMFHTIWGHSQLKLCNTRLFNMRHLKILQRGSFQNLNSIWPTCKLWYCEEFLILLSKRASQLFLVFWFLILHKCLC